MTAPKVFISYSHDNEAHKTWVRNLAQRLQTSGVEVILDSWDLVPGGDVAAFMVTGVGSADRVLMVCSAAYVAKAESGVGGVGYERLIVSREIYERIDTTKFIPVIRDNPMKKTPPFIGTRLYIDFTDDSQFEKRFDELVRALHNVPLYAKPPLGKNPFSGVLPAPESHPPLDWFDQQAAVANAGLVRLGREGAMEVRFALTGTDQWSQLALFDAVRQAEIRTFGWPIGIVLDKDPWRPKPRNDGVFAEVSLTDKGFASTKAYDYWAIRNDGAFYLLQSLFEDERGEGYIFFNTRIVRVAEALLFCAKLYGGLGLGPQRVVTVRIRHQGLKGRALSSSSPSRPLMSAPEASEDVVEYEYNLRLEQMLKDVTEPVMRFCEPLFMIFNFQEFSKKVYEDIVTRFEQGEVS